MALIKRKIIKMIIENAMDASMIINKVVWINKIFRIKNIMQKIIKNYLLQFKIWSKNKNIKIFKLCLMKINRILIATENAWIVVDAMIGNQLMTI